MGRPTKPKRVKNEKSVKGFGPIAIIKESLALQGAWLKFLALYIPQEAMRNILSTPGLMFPFEKTAWQKSASKAVLRFFDDLGPVYGKVAQMTLQRFDTGPSSPVHQWGLDRLFGDWLPLPFSAIEKILDQEIPAWHGQLKIEPYPLGVATMAQVHGAKGLDGKRYVVKVLKPGAALRMKETADALDGLLRLMLPLAKASRSTRRILQDLAGLLGSLKQESDFRVERQSIDKARERLAAKGGNAPLLRIPTVRADLSTGRVLVMERFDGARFSEILAGKTSVPDEVKKKLARKLLKELLVQVFEFGVFHGDPHGGNLILLDDGTVGLFDWGLTGELTDVDRRHIASLLRATIAFDMEALVDALVAMAQDEGQVVDRPAVLKTMQKLAKDLTAGSEKPSLRAYLQLALDAADRIDLALPGGLLMMAKSLMTIEGLAKGLDPDVAMLRVATPVLFRAARPRLKDLLAMAARLPKFF